MNGKQKASEVPVIKSSQMKDADGFLFGLPTRFGSYPSQLKEFFDSCGSLWVNGEL
jgi:NAD(P)H dehydrogenase (quinone)